MSRRRTSLVAPLATAVASAAFAGPAIAEPMDAGPAAAPSSTPAVLRAPAPARAPHTLIEQREAHVRIAGAGRLAIPKRPTRAASAPSDSWTPSTPLIIGAALAAFLALGAGAIAATRRTRVPRTTSA
jgi:hypothetical protein